MRFRYDFVTNSSSTAYMIANTSDRVKTLVDFVHENPDLLDDFLSTYSWHQDDPKFTHNGMIESAKNNNITFQPGEEKYCVFGDEDGTVIGHVYDYMLREGGSSESFTWRFEEWRR